jgi:ABC-2 type transport system ATP-binding protein
MYYPVIKVKNLKKYYPNNFKPLNFIFSRKQTKSDSKITKAVKGISFEISKGEFVGFIGPNGAGKTTTLKCLAGLIHPSSGEINILGYSPFERKKEFLKKISFVMGQKNQLWWDLSALDIFNMNKEIYDMDTNDYKNNLSEFIKLLSVENIIYKPVRQLSLGQKMKLELIASLLHKPEVLFLDEPTIGLDVIMQDKIRKFISSYNKNTGSTVIFTSHYMRDVQQLCKRIIILVNGRIIYDGNTDDIIKKYSKYKIITVYYKDRIPKFIEKIQNINKTEGKLVLSVSRNRVKHIVSNLIKDQYLESINIEDPELDSVIKDIFENNKN